MSSSSSTTRAEIEKYRDDVLRNKVRCDLPHCPRCSTSPDSFRRHQARPRKFSILCEMLVLTVLCLVIRWRCPGCGKTFTQQPPFAFPRKRYTRESILDFSACHVEDEAATYRATVSDEEGMPIFHVLTFEAFRLIAVHSMEMLYRLILAGPREYQVVPLQDSS